MTAFLEGIQDRLSSHIGKGRKGGGIGVLSWAGEGKVNGDTASSHLLETAALVTEFTTQPTPKSPQNCSGDQPLNSQSRIIQ